MSNLTDYSLKIRDVRNRIEQVLAQHLPQFIERYNYWLLEDQKVQYPSRIQFIAQADVSNTATLPLLLIYSTTSTKTDLDFVRHNDHRITFDVVSLVASDIGQDVNTATARSEGLCACALDTLHAHLISVLPNAGASPNSTGIFQVSTTGVVSTRRAGDNVYASRGVLTIHLRSLYDQPCNNPYAYVPSPFANLDSTQVLPSIEDSTGTLYAPFKQHTVTGPLVLTTPPGQVWLNSIPVTSSTITLSEPRDYFIGVLSPAGQFRAYTIRLT